jgi:hypothetical protein
VRFGGRHRLAVHILSNGTRVVESLGPEDGEIVFRGTFSGPDAETRVQLLDNLRLSGAVIWLRWESFRRQIVVKNLVADYHSPWWIPYQVSCIVVHQTGATNALPDVIRTLISTDLASAESAAYGSGLQLAPLRVSLSSTNVLTPGTSDQTQAMSTISLALATANQQVAEQSFMLNRPLGGSPNIEVQATALAAMVGCAGSLASAINTRSYIGRIASNLTTLGN